MTLALRPLHPTLAAEVSGIDGGNPISQEVADALVAANDRYPVLVFRDQHFDDESQVRFASMFGPLEPGSNIRRETVRRVHDALSDISNQTVDGGTRPPDDARRLASIANELWHTDSSFMAVPAKYSMLYAVAVPPAGHVTEFADLRAAYDALDDKMKERIDDLVAEHVTGHVGHIVGGEDGASEAIRAAFPPAPQRMARRHPGSGRKTLYIASHVARVVGWPTAAGRSLLFELIDHATQPQFVYRHVWKPRDLVWWDDRCTMHRARPSWEEGLDVRDMRRATVQDYASTLEQPRALAS